MTPEIAWPRNDYSRVPFWLHHDAAIYELEMERIFRGPAWSYLCLEAEIPNAGDFRTTWVGDTPVIVSRDKEGALHAFINRCSHRGAMIVRSLRGNAERLVCLYHRWCYSSSGELTGLPFRKGLKGEGGMPQDFDMQAVSPRKLKLASCHGMLFGSFSERAEPLEAYLGEFGTGIIKRFLSRPIRILGYSRQRIHGNWKLYAENLRDSYHATLLHTFYTTFKVNRLDMDGGITLSDRKWHHISFARRANMTEAEEYSQSKVHSASYDSALAGPGLLESWNEFDDGITHSIQTIFPNLCVQFTLNSLAIRFFAPRGVDKTELFWIYLGYERDTEAQTQMRILQSNLTGAAGLVSLEDGCINEFVQRGTRTSPQAMSFMEMGGRDVRSEKSSRATEAAVRGFWHGYREIMGF
jgi:anthranilate 1,2-dioxygenase large subunit